MDLRGRDNPGLRPGSSKDLGTRLKYHYYVTPKDSRAFGPGNPARKAGF